MKPPRIHAIPLGVNDSRDATGIKTMQARERHATTYEPKQTYTGPELMARLRGLPEHLRPGQVER